MNFTKDDIKKFVINFMENNLELDKNDMNAIDDDLDLIGSGIMNSLNFIELVTGLEETFKIEIDFEKHDPSEFTTLAGFAGLAAEYSRDENE